MFNLEQEIDKWCRSAKGKGCGQTDRIEELQDHLYCEIARLQKVGGLDEEGAFLKATRKLGDADELGAEYAKNNTVLSKLCAIEQAHVEAPSNGCASTKKASAIIIIHSLFFAAAMLITPLLIENKDGAGMIVITVLIPLWIATAAFLPGWRRTAQCERRFLKRIFGGAR